MNPNCYNIPAGAPFLAILACWVLKHHGGERLPNLLILLPNRRSCRSLREAFLDETGGKPLLLPRIQPIGDLGEEGGIYHHDALESIPSAISTTRRMLLLARLVRRFGKEYSIEQSTELAQHLGRFMDDAARMGLSFDRLGELVPADLSQHWQQTLEFLTIVSTHWPAILAEEGVIDPVDHRNRMLRACAHAWQQTPPTYPIIAAGSTGSQPATADLLSVIARLPTGMVVLPGLDSAMPEKEWEFVSETHPQYALKQLLGHIGCAREEVDLLPSPLRGEGGVGVISQKTPSQNFTPTLTLPPQGGGNLDSRIACLRTIFQPPDSTAGWAQAHISLSDGLSGIRLISADTQFDEARMIAIALRETLETPAKTAALITPDRTLARMVAAQMQRFGIDIDDSAGYPLMDTPTGCFLRLAADMVASKAAPSPLLALLRHPFAAAGLEPAECRRLSRVLETKLLRGIRRTAGLEALLDDANIPKEAHALLLNLCEHMAPLAACFAKKQVPLQTMLEAHLAFAQWLAEEDRLWSGDDGNQLAAFFAELMEHASLLPEIDPASYVGFLEVMMAGEIFRPRFGRHPRLHILSPLEARLLHFDRAILGGLNEGVWPSLSQADPWMSRPMRGNFGLPAPERLIGQSAHDVYLLCAGKEVLLTRASKNAGAPTVPSRWLVRLETLVKGRDPACYETMRADNRYASAKQLLDTPQPQAPQTRPAPVPPMEARPKQLRVTAIDNWLRDPYMVYAHHILKLRPLESLDREPDAADFGTLVHKALEIFTRNHPAQLPGDLEAALLGCGRDAFAPMIDRPAVACLWWPRFEAMAQWLAEQEQQRRSLISHVDAELEGAWEMDVDGSPFTLTTRIDRLETHKDGSVTIIDYKTGTPPSKAEIEKGLANQLSLEALIAQRGALRKANIAALEYWKLAGNPADCDIKPVDIAEIEHALVRLHHLIRSYRNPAQPYAAQHDPSKLPRFNDYAHLTRRDEWEAV